MRRFHKIVSFALALVLMASCLCVLKTRSVAAQNSVKITKQPQSVTVASGQEAKVTFTATGDGLTYKWYFKNKGQTSFSYTSTFTGNTYTAQMNADRNGRQVYCVVTDKYGNKVQTNTVTISMKTTVKITKQPVSVAVANGQNAVVSFTATGDGLTYKWYYKNKGQTSFTLTTTFTGNSYSAPMDATRDGRQVYCVVTDKYGNKVQTNTVTISMKTTVKITKQPVSVTVASGAEAKVSFTATGDGLTYKWYYKNKGQTSFSYTATFTGNTYTAQMNADRNGRQLYCVVTDKYGNKVQTNTVTISMTAPQNTVKITKQPQSVTVANGQNAVVSFTATGDGLSYKWYFKNKGQTSFSYTSTFTGNTYTAQMNAERDGRQIYCVVTDKYGNKVQTNTVTISMGAAVKITQQPISTIVPNGVTAEVSFTATGDGLSYKWYFKNKDQTSFSYTATFTGNTYSAQMNVERDGRQIYCVVSDKYGNSVRTDTVTISMLLLEVEIVQITTQPVSVSAEDGRTATVSVAAIGDGITYQWYYKNKGWTAFSKDSSAKTATYSALMSANMDGRQVYCLVTDAYGNSEKSNVVTLSRLPYKTVYYGANNSIRCVELVNVPFATADKVDWTFEKVGEDEDGDYGFATRNLIESAAPIVNWDYGNGTYMTQYVSATMSDLEDLVAGLISKGFVVNSRDQINGDCYNVTLTRNTGNCNLSYFVQTGKLFLTVSKNMVFSPHLQESNYSTNSDAVVGRTTKLVMIPSEDAGDCYVIQLKNGNFIVFDGGGTKTLKTLLEYMEANTPPHQIPVVEAWFITHGHFDHCGWSPPFYGTSAEGLGNIFQPGEAASRVRVNGVYFNQTADQIVDQCVFSWRSDTPDTGWRTKGYNPWPSRLHMAVAKMKTASGEATPLYRPQAGQIYYFCDLQVEVPYAQEQIPFCDYQMDLNASSTWYLVRSAEGQTFLDAGDTENVNMEEVMNSYTSGYDIYNGNLDIMSLFHHGHNLYMRYRNAFRAPILFLPSEGTRNWNAEAATVYRYYTTKPGVSYKDSYNGGTKRDGLGLECYDYGQGTFSYDFSTGEVTKIS